MPKILERLVRQLEAKGMKEGQARAVATGTLQKNGILKKRYNSINREGS